MRRGHASEFFVIFAIGLALLAGLGFVLYRMNRTSSTSDVGAKDLPKATSSANAAPSPSNGLFVYCAAGMRLPIEEIATAYEAEFHEPIQLQYGGSNTLLSQVEVGRTGDLYLAGDDSYTQLAKEKGLAKETIPVAVMRPVIAVAGGNPKNIQSLDDLLRDDVRTALGNPDQAAIGRLTRRLLKSAGKWEEIKAQVTRHGVFKPTVPEVANDVKLGSADAGIVWDTTLALYPDLESIRTTELDAGIADVTIAILDSSKQPTRALRFARFLAAKDKGLVTFSKHGFTPVPGDIWAATPQITFYCGAVNRRAVDSVIQAFAKREGVVINTIYNGCGMLTAQMRTIRDQNGNGVFPDTYMACDRFYLDNVGEWFQDDVDVSDTEVVIAVPKGNPDNIQSLQDLTKPNVTVAVGQPEQCTIGVLTRQLLKAEGVLDEVMNNVVTQTATSAMLIPTVTTNSVSATLAYATDTLAESDKVDTIRISSEAAKAIQPFAIARSSDHKQLARRLFEAVAASREQFESAGFHFRINENLAAPATQ